ncbi:family 43 glycosylhydrolase [Micromonospora sp. NPDC050200]|uniref:family 43 glycosylhydrolase n=1 Tax=Micromonospora sp. NPDC050200 TaxID=3155664 RepID=UPI003404DD50
MPGGPGRAVAGRTWAPDVQPNPDGSLTLTYTAQDAASGRQCIGVAFANSPIGGFVPYGSRPLICPLNQGGAIDANTFVARDGTRYLSWKNDGNAINQPSTLWVSQVTNNGTTLVGPTTAMLTVPAGQIIEAGTWSSVTTRWCCSTPVVLRQLRLLHVVRHGAGGHRPLDADAECFHDPGQHGTLRPRWRGRRDHMYSINLSWVNGLPVQGGSRKASLDGDGLAEIALIQTDGQVKAWHNDLGFAASPYGYAVIVATGFTDPARVRFIDPARTIFI